MLDELATTAPDVVEAFLRPALGLLRLEHPQPRLLLGEVAKRLANEPRDVLEQAAVLIVEQRTKFVAVKNATDAIATARQLVREGAIKPVGVTITRDGNPPQWAAWRRWAEAARYAPGLTPAERLRARVIDEAREQILVPTEWPPSAKSDQPEGACQ